MKPLRLIWPITLLALMAACGQPPPEEPQPPTEPHSTSPADSPAIAPTPPDATSSGAPPSVTASSAAAAAPECKQIDKTKPNLCQPEANAAPLEK